jgi:hypothetical protein
MTTDDKQPTAEQPETDNSEAKKPSDDHLQAIAADIDRQMKKLAEMNTRVIIAKDQLADLQEFVQAKIADFQERRAADHGEGHSDIMQSIRHAKDEAAKHIRESEAINEAYDKLLKQLERGREAALRESRKAEVVLKEKFHEVEEKLLKKAGEIKDTIKNRD